MPAAQFNGDYLTIGTVGSACTLYTRFRVTSYASWGNPIAFDEDQDDAALEYNEEGDLYLIASGVVDTFSTGGATNWFDVAFVANGTSATAYGKIDTATSWTTIGTWTTSSSAAVVIGAWPSWSPAGTQEHSGTKVWDAALTPDELLREATQLTPVRWLNLRFYNPMYDGSTCHVNQLAGGSDGSVTGTIATSATAQSGLVWRRRSNLYVRASAGGGAAATSGVPGASRRNLQRNPIYRMSGRDESALFVPDKKIHVVPALPASMRRRQRAFEAPLSPVHDR